MKDCVSALLVLCVAVAACAASYAAAPPSAAAPANEGTHSPGPNPPPGSCLSQAERIQLHDARERLNLNHHAQASATPAQRVALAREAAALVAQVAALETKRCS
jgi:Spy/CpxP family protein refolding chaperone